MKQNYTFLSLAEEILSESEMPMTINDIWDSAVKKGLDKKLGSNGQTPVATLGARLYKNVKKSEDKQKFMIVSKKPTLFWLISRKNELPSQEKIDDFLDKSYSKLDEKSSYNERMIHQVLANYINNCPLGHIYAKTIFHENSIKGKKGQDKWTYPDMVGVSFIFSEDDYSTASIELMKLVQYPMCKFYSFELKKSLNFGNYKESYFQAVSNSSWSNEGYLVCVDIDDEVKHELKRLCDSFGVGLIQLNIDNIDNSVIIYPSAVKPIVDIATIELLVSKNKDFLEFISNVNNSIKLNQVVDEAKYDKVLSDDEINKYLLKLKAKNNKI